MLDQTEVIDNVSDLSVAVAGCYEDPTVADALAEMYRNEEAIDDADLAAMHAAAEADGLIDFGPFDRAAWEETMSRFPEGTGLFPQIGQTGHAEYPWSAELRRPGKGTYDVVPCLTWRTQKEAWAACVSRALAMVALCECGKRELAEGMFIKAAK